MLMLTPCRYAMLMLMSRFDAAITLYVSILLIFTPYAFAADAAAAATGALLMPPASVRCAYAAALPMPRRFRDITLIL